MGRSVVYFDLLSAGFARSSVALKQQTPDNPAHRFMVALIGPLAMANHESRQARKGATVVVTLCAEVWLVRVTAIMLPHCILYKNITLCSTD